MRRHIQLRWVALIVALLAMGQIVAPTFAPAASESNGVLRTMGNEIAAVVEKTRPAVVSIQSTKMEKVRNPFQDFEQILPPEFRERFGPNLPREFKDLDRPRHGLGSGFIIDPSGLILTNNHVVVDPETKKPMENLKVILSDGREFKPTVLGTDPDTEVALIKIDGKNLPSIELGDSDSLKIGNFAIAIGSPMALQFNGSVTFGIVSALNRSIGITTYEGFIQTDAAINAGNSGGPLLDVDGKVVGINTAIVSRSGGSEGLGLAIPINQARKVADALRKGGKVRRGFLGLKGVDLGGVSSPDTGAYVGTGDRTGALIIEVQPGTPAEKAGLRVKDAIVEINGEKIVTYEEFRHKIGGMAPGDTAKLKIMRDGKEKSINVTLGERPSMEELMQIEKNQVPSGEGAEKTDLGFTVKTLTPEMADALGYQGKKGVVVTEVNPAGEAAQQGLQAKTLIVEVNNKKVETVADFKKALEAGKSLKSVFLKAVDEKGGEKLIIVPKEE